MIRSKISKTHIKLFFLSTVVLTVIFLFLGYIMLKNVERYAYQEKMKSSVNTAKAYSYTVSKNISARDALISLMDEKIEIAGETLLIHGAVEGMDLTNLALDLNVDTIDFYNPEGVVVASTQPGNLGWTVYEGHPVNDFYKSGERSFVGEIRTNTISGLEFKYGYFRMSDGSFFQVGVSAETINKFISSFALMEAFGEIKSTNALTCLCYIDENNRVIASTEPERVGLSVTDEDVITIIAGDTAVGNLDEVDGAEVYQTYVPILHEGKRIGTLLVGEDFSSTRTLINRISYAGVIIMASVYAGIIFLLLTTHKRNNELIEAAYFDEASELPNQRLLREILEENRFRAHPKKQAVVLIQSLEYKNLHHEYGNEHLKDLVKVMVKRITEECRFSVRVFSYTDDRFLILVEDYETKNELVALTKEITKVMELPVRTTKGIDILKVKFGITELDPEDTKRSMVRVLKEASVALSTISKADKVNYAFFSELSGRKLQMEEVVEQELRTVIADDHITSFYLVFQPLVAMQDGSIVAFEALARFVSKKYGEIPPVKFIEIAEKKELIHPIGKIILTKACRYAKKLKDKGYGHIRVSVNISGLQILSGEFIDDTKKILEKEQVDGSSLIFEISENSLVDHIETLNEKLQVLREMGIVVSLDNFGTGASSLHHLKGLRVDMLKIDKLFIEPLTKEDPSTLITKDIISMAQGMGLQVVAEGVEEEGQLDYLVKHSCDMVQGYLLSEPLQEEEANLLLIASPYSLWPKLMEKQKLYHSVSGHENYDVNFDF